MIGLVWAQAAGRVIGKDGGMPWHLPEDLAHFKSLTLGASVVMGRRTWESFPPRFRPLPGRRNIVVSRQGGWHADGAEVAASLDEALSLDTDLWVIGGAGLFEATMPVAHRLEVTDIDLVVDGDTLAPVIGAEWHEERIPADGWLTSRAGLRYRFRSLLRV